MTMEAYEEADTHEMVYLVRVTRAEFEKASFSEADFAMFRRCQQGSVSSHILGLSVLAKRIEEGEVAEALRNQLPKSWRERVGEMLDETEGSK